MKLKFPGLGRITGQQRGFTLVEILIVIAITGLLAGVISTAISQLVTINSSSSNRMVAIKQVEKAVDVIRRDVIMAQKIDPDYPSGFPLVLTWTTWSNEENIITYELNSATKELVRTQSDNGTESSRVLAQHIESISMEDADTYAGGKIILTITANVGAFRPAMEVRSFDIFPRPAP